MPPIPPTVTMQPNDDKPADTAHNDDTAYDGPPTTIRQCSNATTTQRTHIVTSPNLNLRIYPAKYWFPGVGDAASPSTRRQVTQRDGR